MAMPLRKYLLMDVGLSQVGREFPRFSVNERAQAMTQSWLRDSSRYDDYDIVRKLIILVMLFYCYGKATG